MINQQQENYLLGELESLPSNTCPQDQPFVIGGACKSCEGELFLFDAQNQQCTSCPKSTYFSEKSHSCEKENPDSGCSGGQYENIDGVCLCRPEKPFWNGQQCIECFAPKYFDFYEMKCFSCGEGKFYSSKDRTCKAANC